MLPERERCLELLEAAGCSEDVRQHVRTVERLASRLAQHHPHADAAVVQAGALLHDVGRGFDHGPQHVPRGLAFLEQEGIDERVVRCVARHMGAGIDAEQAQAWGWPSDRSYEPETIEERIVCHADNLTFGTRYGSLARAQAKLREDGLDDVAEDVAALHDALAQELGVDPDTVAAELEASRTEG